MKTSSLWLLFVFAMTVCGPYLHAAIEDPLTSDETNQLRDVADDPPHKLKLYVKFIDDRIQNIEKVRADRLDTKNRGQRIHDLIEEFTTLSDELGDNVDDADAKNADLRKVLPDIIGANAAWQKSLESLQQAESNPRTAAEASAYDFVLTNALETVKYNAGSYDDVLKKQREEMPKLKKEEEDKKH